MTKSLNKLFEELHNLCHYYSFIIIAFKFYQITYY